MGTEEGVGVGWAVGMLEGIAVGCSVGTGEGCGVGNAEGEHVPPMLPELPVNISVTSTPSRVQHNSGQGAKVV